MVQKHTKIVEFWFDGGWEKSNQRWPVQQLYSTIKASTSMPSWNKLSIGLPDNPDYHPVLPENQKEGFPIRYFPSDFS